METIQGQITYRRAVSKKLVFYDVLCSSDSTHAAGKTDVTSDTSGSSSWMEVVVKQDVYGSIQDVKDLRDKLKLGDTVAVQGSYESDHVLQATAITVLQAWKDQHPNVAFKPQPCTRHYKPTLNHQQQQQADVAGGGSPAAAAGVSSKGSLAVGETAEPAVAAGSGASNAAATVGSTAPAAAQSAHPAAAAASVAAVLKEPQLAVCKFWVNTGRCAKGDACPYAHLVQALDSWKKQRSRQRVVLSSSLGYCHSQSAAAKRLRAQLFAAWLVDTYGREALNAGAGVLDVAGGAGGMTYELTVVHGIKCTLVDPRPLKLNKQQHKQLSGAGTAAVLDVWTAEQLQQGCLVPQQQPVRQQQQQQQQPQQQVVAQEDGSMNQQQHQPENRLKQPLEQQQEQQQQGQETAAPGDTSSFRVQSAAAAAAAAAAAMALPDNAAAADTADATSRDTAAAAAAPAPAPAAAGSLVRFQQVQGWFGPELWQSAAWQTLFSSCSLVIGLHPDQATEPIVDYALEAGLGFAVMPCCVFPRLFPDRRLVTEEGSVPVGSYSQLVHYLTQKGQGQQQVLDFVGANIVVFRQQTQQQGLTGV